MKREPLPIQFRQSIPSGQIFFKLIQTLEKYGLNTVCEEAKCPNRTECYARGTLTFQILGDICTRRCGFCAETTGTPHPIDLSEPEKMIQAAKELNLSHIVITAPARDDLADGGASQFASTIQLLKENLKNVTVEILISDLQGNVNALKTVLDAGPDVFNHNIETVKRLTPTTRAKATYDRSLEILKFAFAYSREYKIKSGLMLGLGEDLKEIYETLVDLQNAGVQYLTIGQYLQPSLKHLPIKKYYDIKEFEEIKKIAETQKFEKIFCGPLVRSSYHADEMVTPESLKKIETI